MSEADTMRGEEVAIGKLKFVMPKEPPMEDEQVIANEILIAQIDKHAAPFRQIHERAELAKKILRTDITAAFRMRLEEKEKGPSLADVPGVEIERPRSEMSGGQLRAVGEARRKNKGVASS